MIQNSVIAMGSSVTSKAAVLLAGPCAYHGFTLSRGRGKSGVTLCISDSATAGTTGSDILDWCYGYAGGTSVIGTFINARSAQGVKVVNGLRVQAMGLQPGGTTICVYWG